MRAPRWITAAALAGAAAWLGSQTPEATPAPAEAAFAQALDAKERGDLPAYRDAIERTAELLPDPTRLLYRLGSARLLAGDRPGAIAAFRRMVDASFYRDPREDPEYAPLLADAAFQRELARLDALLEPIVRSAELFRLPKGGLLLEGLAYDPGRKAWYLSSVDARTLFRRDVSGAVVELAGPDELAAPLALAVDGARQRLWVVSAGLPHARDLAPEALDRSALVAFDLASGRRVARIDSPPGKHLWNDLALAGDGALYVSDPGHAAIERVRPDGHVETLVEGSGLRSPGGLAISADGRRLYVADWSQGLAVVDLATGRLSWLTAPADGTTLGVDGLYRIGDDLVAIQNGVVPPRVTRFRLAVGGLAIVGAEILERAHPEYDEPTLGVVVDGALAYVANSHWPAYGADGKPREGVERAPGLVLRLPLEEKSR
ncbi:MAG: hypothetical protein KDB94_03795 [Acidobacteria bacterium]|nr:hypothetical protein [Acidobacteriota bacterium]MCB9378834.1 hypothetical protein [Holophagales bacterium]